MLFYDQGGSRGRGGLNTSSLSTNRVGARSLRSGPGPVVPEGQGERQSFLVSHPSGNANVRQLCLGLAEAGMLDQVRTGLAFGRDPALTLPGWGLLPGRLQRELRRRLWPAALAPQLRSDPLPDLLRLSLFRNPLLRGTTLPASLTNWHYRSHDHRVAAWLARAPRHSLPSAVYAYEDAAAATLSTARRRGLATFLELPTLHSRTVHRWHLQEARRNPAYRPMLGGLNEPAWKLRRKRLELEAADWIVVASTLVRDSCVEAGIAPGRLLVIPYGAPVDNQPAGRLAVGSTQAAVAADPNPAALEPPRRPIALYVGRLTPAKGIQDLVAAWSTLHLPGAELQLAGMCDYPSSWVERLPPSVRWLGSLPQAELAQRYAEARLFVFPSLIDGYSLAVLEAMASGLPVLLTDRCGNRDLIEQGVNGWVVPAADPEALAAQLGEVLSDAPLCQRVGEAARASVAGYGWQAYQGNLVQQLRHCLAEPRSRQAPTLRP